MHTRHDASVVRTRHHSCQAAAAAAIAANMRVLKGTTSRASAQVHNDYAQHKPHSVMHTCVQHRYSNAPTNNNDRARACANNSGCSCTSIQMFVVGLRTTTAAGGGIDDRRPHDDAMTGRKSAALRVSQSMA